MEAGILADMAGVSILCSVLLDTADMAVGTADVSADTAMAADCQAGSLENFLVTHQGTLAVILAEIQVMGSLLELLDLAGVAILVQYRVVAAAVILSVEAGINFLLKEAEN